MAEGWVVTEQKQTNMQTSGGQWVEAMRVDFKTTSGVLGFVLVPMSQYNTKTVADLIEARKAAIDAVAQL